MKNIKTFFLTLMFLILTGLLLACPLESLAFSLTGLQLWFNKMIPALLPFMILSGMMVRLSLTEYFARIASPVLTPFLNISLNGIYAVIVGFLCGFPMGAKTIAELYSCGKLTRQEASYLLAFCNNIGPVYFISFVLPALGLRQKAPYLFGMYGLPLLYGIFLRYTVYRDKIAVPHSMPGGTGLFPESLPPHKLFSGKRFIKGAGNSAKGLSAQEKPSVHANPCVYGKAHSYGSLSAHRSLQARPKASLHKNLSAQRKVSACENQSAHGIPPASGQLPAPSRPVSLLDTLDDAILSGLYSISKLGGYMVLFNLLNLVPHIFMQPFPVAGTDSSSLANCLLEITSGISRVGAAAPLPVLLLLPFGGFSCIAQTYSMIKETDLSLPNYILHKLALTMLTAVYYGLFAFLFPSAFLL